MNINSRLKQLWKLVKDADGCDNLPDALCHRRQLARLLQLTKVGCGMCRRSVTTLTHPILSSPLQVQTTPRTLPRKCVSLPRACRETAPLQRSRFKRPRLWYACSRHPRSLTPSHHLHVERVRLVHERGAAPEVGQ